MALRLVWVSVVFGIGSGAMSVITGLANHSLSVLAAAALATVSAVITIQAAVALATGSRPGTSGVTLIAAAVSLVVLTPLAYAKRWLGGQMASRALQGDGTLSGIGAATSLLELTAPWDGGGPTGPPP